LKYEDRITLDADLSTIKEKQKEQTQNIEKIAAKRDNLLTAYFKDEFYKTMGFRN